METQRLTPAGIPQPTTTPPAQPGLTRAEERALRRSEPLSAAQFKELRMLAEQGVSPLRRI